VFSCQGPDHPTKTLLLHGPSKDGRYPFTTKATSSSPLALLGERASIDRWHSKLGHPAFKVVSRILSKFNLPVVRNNNGPMSCPTSKSKQLVFFSSSTRVKNLLELIYTNVWGPSPLFSNNGFKYYVSFLDSHSRYTWLFPMVCKGDVFTIFTKFQKQVERIFDCKIKYVQFDWGGSVSFFSKNFPFSWHYSPFILSTYTSIEWCH
jgi:hypothetical protein